MAIFSRSSSFSRVTTLAAQRPVHAAFAWLHGNPQKIMAWQKEMVAIPAPPFGEKARAEWLAARFAEAGLSNVGTDAVGNVSGMLPATKLPAESTGPVVVLSAHLDTVFPAETPLNPVLEGDRLAAPGACDNGAGVAGMLAIAHALSQAKVELPAPLVFLGNVGEEGEGDLRGVRHFYEQRLLAGRIAAHIVLDGAGADSAVTQALGSRRFHGHDHGPGGHSFTDAGVPNPIAALASALAVLADVQLPDEPRTTLNLGTIRGGTSVNSIPESAQASIDLRSTDPEQLVRLEVALHRAVEDAVARANAKGKADRRGRREASYLQHHQDWRPSRGAFARRLASIGGVAGRGPSFEAAHRSSSGLDGRKHPALARCAGAVDWRRWRRAAALIRRPSGTPPRIARPA